MAGSGLVTTYRDLDERSNRLAHLLRDAGLRTGDHIALMMENGSEFLEVAWAAQRSGLYYTALNSHLRRSEAQHILDDCGATAFFISAGLAHIAGELDLRRVGLCIVVGGEADGFPALRRRTGTLAGDADRGRSRRPGDALFVGNHRSTQGRAQGPVGRTDGRSDRHPGDAGRQHRPGGNRRRLGLPLPCSAVPLRAPRLLDGDAPARCHLCGHGVVRAGEMPRSHRAVPGHPRPIRSHHVHPHASAERTRRGTRTISRACGGWSMPPLPVRCRSSSRCSNGGE